MGIRDTAAVYLLQLPPFPVEVTSNGPLAALFTKLSGITHTMLLQSWGLAPRPDGTTRADAGPGLTSCNGFVGIYGNSTGMTEPTPAKSLGRFFLDKKLQQMGKGHAWIPSTAGARPKFGDVFELAGRLHQGISLDFDGDVWNTAEGGQGGKSTGPPPFDIIKRKQARQTSDVVTNNKGETLKGWVDIERFVNGPPPTTVPGWLPGWWSVPWRGRTFFYFFDSNFTASWTFSKPVSNALAPLTFDDTATVTFDDAKSITLKWSKTGSVERFSAATEASLVGTWNAVEPLIATKMF
jgi:hypothetical protein